LRGAVGGSQKGDAQVVAWADPQHAPAAKKSDLTPATWQ